MKILRAAARYGLYLFAFLLPWQARYILNQAQLGGLPWEFGTTSLHATEILLLALLIVAMIIHFKDYNEELHYKGRKVLNILLLAAVFLFISAATIFFALDRVTAAQNFIHLAEGVGLMVLIGEISFSVHALGWWLVASASIQGIIATLQFYFQSSMASTILGISEKLPQIPGISVIESASGRFLRGYGTFDHPNILAAFLVIGLLSALALLFSNRSRFERVAIFLSSVLMSAGLFFTFSRSGWLCLLIVAFVVGSYLAVNRQKSLAKFFLEWGVVIILPVLLLSAVHRDILISRYFSPQIISSASVTDRVSEYAQSRSLVEKYWYKGTGIGNYTLALEKDQPNIPDGGYQPVHNIYLLVLIETGLAGMIFFILLLLEILKIITRFNALYHQEILDELKRFKDNIYETDYGKVTYWYVCFSGLLIGFLSWFFLDHFFWTLYPGIMMWWFSLGLWLKLLIRMKS